MAGSTTSVTHTTRSTSRLPDWAVPGALALDDLRERGMCGLLLERVRIQREGGFPGFDVFLFLLFLFAGGGVPGIRSFWRRAGDWSEQLAALAGREGLPSSSAMSRALARVSMEEVRALRSFMLFDVPGLKEVLQHPSCQMRDATGALWHGFHKDGTRKVFRQRALPRATDEMPEARRRSVDARQGYTGRKRGEVQYHRQVVQHAGSGAWLMSELAPGNGNQREELMLALDTVQETMECLGHPLDRSVLCMDGADGWVPTYHACRAKGVAFVTRLTRPELLDQQDVRERLRTGTWYVVPDSGSGPRRLAIDLGIVTVRPGPATRRPDGGAYEPVDVRVVVTRFEQPDRDRGCGRRLDGWRYEMFATTLDSEAWPASEVVWLYYNRCGQENQFLHEDRELGLDHIFSYHIPGQAFATLVGLAFWNLQIAMGFRATPPPVDAGPCRPRELEPDATPCTLGLVEPSPKTDEQPLVEVELPELERRLLHMVAGLEIEKRIPEGWVWDPDKGLSCEDSRPLLLSGVTSPKNSKRPELIFKRPHRGCEECPTRPGCLVSADPHKAKQWHFMLNEEQLHPQFREVMNQTQLARRRERSKKAFRAKRPMSPSSPANPFRVQAAADPAMTHTVGCASSSFLPAAARARARDRWRDVEIFVEVIRPTARESNHPLVAANEEVRQHRRQTWTQRQRRNGLLASTLVQVTIGWPPGHPALEDHRSNTA